MTSTKPTKIKNTELLNTVESKYLKVDIPNIRIGDTLKLGIEIKEGEKTRVQAYEGVVISKKGAGINLTVTVRRIMQGIGIERCFLIHSPKVKFRIRGHICTDNSSRVYIRGSYGEGKVCGSFC